MPPFSKSPEPRDYRFAGEGRWVPAGHGNVRQAHRVEPGTSRLRNAAPPALEEVSPGPAVPRAGRSESAPPEKASREIRLEHPLSRGRTGFRPRILPFAGLAAVGVAVVLVVSAVMMPLVLPGPSATSSLAATQTPDGTARASLPGTPAAVVSASEVVPASPAGRSASPMDNSVFRIYRVALGDNLTRIANDFDLSVTTLYWANSQTVPNPDLVRIGQALLIPPVDGKVVTAKAGETPQSIADQYGIDAQVIVDANNLSGLALDNGKMLILPGVENKPLPRPISGKKPADWLNKLTWPVPASHLLTLLFGCTGWPAEPAYGSCRHWHNALDIGARWGTPVVAAAPGTVIYAGWRRAGTDGAAGGIVVWISHGGTLYTTYNHLSGVTVKAGQRVTAGQQVGRIGATGAADGAHLHFEVWIDYPWTGGTVADSRDPLKYTSWKP